MDDTKYFEQAVTEYCLKRSMCIKVGDLTMGELSLLLLRAQELKAADYAAAQIAHVDERATREFLQGKPQPIVAALNGAEEIR